VEALVFDIRDVFLTPGDFEGEVTLAGVRIGTGDLAVGDDLWCRSATGVEPAPSAPPSL